MGATGNTSATRPKSGRRRQRGQIGHPGPLERSAVAPIGEDSRVLGLTNPDPVGELLGTGYLRFQSPSGIDGLAKENGDRLDLLAVNALVPGIGQFRRFIQRCKREYETICIWEVWNPMLHEILQRYGFRAYSEKDRHTGERLEGYRYDAGHK